MRANFTKAVFTFHIQPLSQAQMEATKVLRLRFASTQIQAVVDDHMWVEDTPKVGGSFWERAPGSGSRIEDLVVQAGLRLPECLVRGGHRRTAEHQQAALVRHHHVLLPSVLHRSNCLPGAVGGAIFVEAQPEEAGSGDGVVRIVGDAPADVERVASKSCRVVEHRLREVG